MRLTRLGFAGVPAFAIVTLLGQAQPPSDLTVYPARHAVDVAAMPSDFNGDGVEDRAMSVPWQQNPDWLSTGAVHVQYGTSPDGTHLQSQFFSTRSPGLKTLLRMYPMGLGNDLVSGDFDRDGFADLALSIPGFDEPDPALQRINVGAVVVIPGSPLGLDGDAARLWSQDSPGVQDVSEDDDDFGSALAVGDFDGDDFLDLAIGADSEQTGPNLRFSGSLTVLYGGRNGLTARDQVISQDSRGILDDSERNDWAGGSLAAGDFDGDGVDDLVMGVSEEGVDGRSNAGAVNVIYGTRDVGLTGAGDRFVHEGLDAIPGNARRDAYFGAVLATGDFNGDQLDDLAIGAPEETIDGYDDTGSVTVIPGTSTGLRLLDSVRLGLQQFDQWEYPRARFGAALASGDVDGDGYDELAIGSPGYHAASGRVDVLKGTALGLSAVGTTTLVPSEFALNGLIEGNETFGTALQFASFDTTEGADLLISLPRADLATEVTRRDQAGGVVLVASRDGMLDPDTSRWSYQGAPGVSGVPEEWERFGHALPGSSDYID